MNKTAAYAVLLFTLVALPACESLPDWLGSAEDVPLAGERIAVMSAEVNLTPDADLATDEIEKDSSIAPQITKYSSIQAGEAPPNKFSVITSPLIIENKIFISDGLGNISAYNISDLKKLWSFTSQNKDKLPGGGMAYANGVIYATNGWGNVIAISADSGTEIWRKNLGAPIRKSGATSEDKLFVATADNQLFALNLLDGETIWRHSGSTEPTINYGSPTPAVKGETIVIAYSSGEVFAINSNRGSELWAETVSSGAERRNTASLFIDVSAKPILVDGFAYVASQNGSVIAYNISNGYRIWEQKIGSINSTPHLQGKYIFVIGDNNKIVALNRFDGRVKWVNKLPVSENKKEIINYSGPAFAGGKLYIASSHGKILSFDANNGKLLEEAAAPSEIYAKPLINAGKLYLLNNQAELAVY